MMYEYDQHSFAVCMLTITPYDIIAHSKTNYLLDMDLTLENRSILPVRNIKVINALENINGAGTYTITEGANEGLSVIIPEDIQELGPYEKKTYTISIQAEGPVFGTIEFSLVSDENESGWQDIAVDYTIEQSYPVVKATPSYLMTGLAKGSQSLEYVTIKNIGLEALKGLSDVPEMTLSPAGGTPSFNWTSIASDTDFDSLAPGDEMSVCLAFNPPEQVSDGTYEYLLDISGQADFHYTYHVYFTVSSNQTGDCEFYVKDVYTGSQVMDKNGNLKYDNDGNPEIIYGVNKASITLQNHLVPSMTFTADTGDENAGIAFFEDIPVGKYYYRINAPEHKSASGIIRIKPNVAVTEELALAYQAVTIEWAVVPVTIEDKYEIKLTTTFKANVPAPVIVVEPPGVNLPDMKKGDVFNGEYIITNQGLAAATDVVREYPDSDEYFTYEYFGPKFSSIAPKQTIVIPYRLICHTTPFGDDEGAGEGGESYSSHDKYSYKCKRCPTDPWGTCSFGHSKHIHRRKKGGGGGGGKYIPWGFGSGPGPDFGFGPGSGWIPFKCPSPNGSSHGRHCFNDHIPSASEVDPKQGTYIFQETDLVVPTRGGGITLDRKYLSSVTNAIAPELEHWPLGKNWLLPSLERLRYVYAYKFKSFAPGRGFSSIPGNAAQSSAIGRTETTPVDEDLQIKLLTPPSDLQGLTEDDYDIVLSDGAGEVRRYVKSSENIAAKPDDYDDTIIIKLDDGGFLWRHVNGSWKKYDGHTGNLLYIGDRRGNYTKFTYDFLNRLMKISDGKDPSKFITFIYQGNSMLISKAADSIGREVNYAYEDGRNNLTQVIDVRGNVTDYTCDDLHRMTSKSYHEPYWFFFEEEGPPPPSERTVYMEYEGAGDGRISAVYFKDLENEFGYGVNSEVFGKFYEYLGSADNSVTGIVSSMEGREYEKTYDFEGNVLKIKGPYGVLETYAYEMNNKDVPRKIIHMDGAGNTETEVVDIWKRFTSKTDKDGNEIKYTYTEPADADITVADNVTPRWSDVKEVKDELGRITRFAYDQKGNITCLTQAADTPQALAVRFNYDDCGNVTDLFLPGDENNDPTYHYEYNADGYITRTVEKLSSDQSVEITYAYTYDSYHKLIIEITDGKGKLWYLRMNQKGDLESIRRPGDTKDYIRLEYDCVDNLKKSIILPDASSGTRATRYKYWQNNLIKSIQEVVEENTPAVEFLYDRDGLLTKVKDEGGKTSEYAYDLAGRNILERDGEGNETIYDYLTRSSFCTACNQAGAYGRKPTAITTPAGGMPGATHTWSIEYDRLERPISFTNELGGQIHLAYDKVGNVTQLIDENSKVYVYTYDALDRITTTSVNGQILYQYTYDTRGNLQEIYSGSGSEQRFVVGYEYHRNGLVHFEHRPLGQSIEYRYDENTNLSSIIDAKNQRIDYLYNDYDQLDVINYFNAGDHNKE